MKDFKYYRDVGVPYPTKPDFTTVWVYLRGIVLFSGKWEDFLIKREEGKFPEGYTEEEVYDKDALYAARKEYHYKQAALNEEFAKDMYKEFGVEDNPKRHMVFQKAWEHGHSSGNSEVYSWFSDLVDLITD